MQETRIRFIALVALTVVSAYIAAPLPDRYKPEFLRTAKVKLGIDLAGGAELKYRLLYPEDFRGDKNAAVQETLRVLDKRVDTLGVKDTRMAPEGDDKIAIQLAGIDRTELENFKRIIRTVGKLELKEVATRETFEKYERTKEVPSGFEAYDNPREGSDPEYAYIQNKILTKKEPIVTGRDVTSAVPHKAFGEGWVVNYALTRDGELRQNEAAARLFKQDPKGKLAIILDGILKSAPRVMASENLARITGIGGEKEAKDLANVLKSGSLPVPIGRIENGILVPGEPETSNFVGPSLGQDSIQRGIAAMAIASGAVAIFMIVYYLAGGVIAVVTLLLNLLFLMAGLAMFGTTLTFPGIAGLVLTVGMAVDANILIFERIREEMAKGKTALQAFEAGHERAFSAIFDSNLTTLMTAIVLYLFGTGPVRGFAVTLSVGILTTMFSVLFCGKTLLHLLVLAGAIRQFRMLKILGSPNVQFTKFMRPCLIVSSLVVAGSLVLFASTDDRKYDIDFKGGTVLHFGFRNAQKIDAVRGKIRDCKDPVTNDPRYPDANIRIMAEPGQGLGTVAGITTDESAHFQLSTAFKDSGTVRKDVQTIFAGDLSHEPFETLPLEEVPKNQREFQGGAAGGGTYVWFDGDLSEGDLQELDRKIKDGFKEKGFVTKDSENGTPYVKLRPAPTNPDPPGLTRAMFLLFEEDVKKSQTVVGEAQTVLRRLGRDGAIPLSRDPISYENNIGPQAAEEMRDSTLLALIVSWALMIVYIAFRFFSWKFGLAAVIALVHDALVSVGAICLCLLVVPKSWGLSFEMNLNTVAALLTIIGYSVNDTIVTFDRIRENLILMKKESFADIVNVSINQTLSRTILTSFTAWMTVVILYALTMQSGGGIASFAFPMLVGMIAGVYSTIYIAGPLLVGWFKTSKPVVAK